MIQPVLTYLLANLGERQLLQPTQLATGFTASLTLRPMTR